MAASPPSCKKPIDIHGDITMSESGHNLNLSRRKFMTVSSAAIAAPFVMKMTGTVPLVKAAEKEVETPYEGIKSVVIYYSQSGGTKKIGQAIQRGILSQTGQCDLVRVKEIKPEELEKYDLIGIGSMTMSSCPAPLVVYFCKGLPPTLKDKHFFWFSTHGILPGRCIIRGVQPLQEAGMTVIGWKDWYSDSSLPGHGTPWYTHGHPDEIDLAEAETFGSAMVVHSRKIFEGDTDIIPALPSSEASDQIYGVGHPFVMPLSQTQKSSSPPAIPTSSAYVCQLEGLPANVRTPAKDSYGSEALKIDPDKCIRCRLCVRGCPCNNIDDSVFPYAFISQDCEFCLYCEGICPTGAITTLDNYLSRQQPEMPEGEIPKRGGGIISGLSIAEATGRFRRLLKEEDVGHNTPWESVTTHPRHKELP